VINIFLRRAVILCTPVTDLGNIETNRYFPQEITHQEKPSFTFTICLRQIVWEESTNGYLGRAIAQAVDRRLVAEEARARAQVSPCAICGGQSGNVTGLSPTHLVFPCQYYLTITLHSLMYLVGVDKGPVTAVPQQRTLSPNRNNTI
jgi:hypothetical protein